VVRQYTIRYKRSATEWTVLEPEIHRRVDDRLTPQAFPFQGGA
jgi:hypothetical protein